MPEYTTQDILDTKRLAEMVKSTREDTL